MTKLSRGHCGAGTASYRNSFYSVTGKLLEAAVGDASLFLRTNKLPACIHPLAAAQFIYFGRPSPAAKDLSSVRLLFVLWRETLTVCVVHSP